MFGSWRPWKAWSWRISSNTITLASKVFASLEAKVGSQPFSAPTLLAGPNPILNRTSHPTRGISAATHCSGQIWKQLPEATSQPESRLSTQIRNINRQWTPQPVLLSPWKCFVPIFPDDLCYIPEMQILPLALNKCIRAVLMFPLNRAVSLPVLPCLVSGGGTEALWHSTFPHSNKT